MIKKSKSFIGLVVSFVVFVILFNFAFFSSMAYAEKASSCTLGCEDGSSHTCPAPCEVRGTTIYCNGGNGSNYSCW